MWRAAALGPRQIGLRSAFREPLDSFLALMRGLADAQNAPHAPWRAHGRSPTTLNPHQSVRRSNTMGR